MKMPESSLLGPGFKDNKNPPQVRFIRKNGRIIPIVQGKKKTSLSPVVEGRINEMSSEVRQAQQGKRLVAHNRDTDTYVNFAEKSTFPRFYSRIKFKNKDDFFKTIEKKSGPKFEKILDTAVDDLQTGYDTPYGGAVPPNEKFLVGTKQVFDNRNVIFRRIDDRIVPIKLKSRIRKSQDDDYVPF